MEDNIHDDKLDDYVRKSFEGHEEDTPADMWERVEGELLPSTEAPLLRVAFRRYGWQAVAAAVILLLLSTLVCEHLYYEEKLRALTEKLSEAQEFPTENPSEVAALSNQNGANQAQKQGTQTDPNLGIEKIANPAPPLRVIHVEKPAVQNPSQKKNPVAQKSETAPALSSQGLRGNAVSNPSTAGGFSGNEEKMADTNFEASEAQHFPKTIDLASIPTRNTLLKIPEPLPAEVSPEARAKEGKTPEPLHIKPVREHSGWYVGVQATPLAAFEKNRVPASRPERPLFASKQEKADISSIWWLKAGKKLSPRFSLESGIGYQKTLQTATHTPQFRFGDGTPNGALRNFDYEISIYNGTAEVSLRMETTPGAPPPDVEPVTLKIKTAQRAELLRIPLLAGYRFGSGRLQGNVKAGLLGNFVLKNEIDISARVSQNPEFRPVEGSDGYTVRLSQPRKSFLGYWLSAGAEFKLGQHLSLVAEPSFLGDFPRNDRSNRRLPERFSVGLNVGANFYF